MAKKLKKWLPTHEQIHSNQTLKLFAPHLSDPRLWHFNRHCLEKAVYIGVLCAFFPLPGQMPLALIGALIFRANVPMALGLTWITNPLTTLPIFYASYQLGAKILDTPNISIKLIAQMIADFSTWIFAHGANPFITYKNSFSISAFCLGLLVLGIICSIICGILFKIFWRMKVIHTWKKRHGYRPNLKKNNFKKPTFKKRKQNVKL